MRLFNLSDTASWFSFFFIGEQFVELNVILLRVILICIYGCLFGVCICAEDNIGKLQGNRKSLIY